MGDKTKIEWTDASWNPIVGCRRASAGCEKCYAERLAATRLSQTPRYKGLAVMKPGGPRWTGEYRYTGVGRERLSDEVADLLPGVDADERERAIDLVVGRCIQVARDQVGRDGHYDGPTMVVTELERLL